MALKYKISFDPDLTTVHLAGNIDEHVGEALRDILSQARGQHVVFDCEQVNLINSIGVATWLAHIRAFSNLKLYYARCPYTFTSLCLIIPDLTAGGTVQSLYVRHFCEHCEGDHQHQVVLAMREETLKLGNFKLMPCPRCRNIMRLEPDDEDFLQVFDASA